MRVVATCGGPLASRHVELPAGTHPLPGPAWLVAERGVLPRSGPYVSLRVWVPALRGSRFSPWPAVNAISTIAAHPAPDGPIPAAPSPAASPAAPAPATLRWWADASLVEVIWEEAGLVLRATSVSRQLVRPAKVEIRVGAPRRLAAGLARDADADAWLAGRHLGLIMSGPQPAGGWAPAVRWRAARQRRAAEPALAGRSGGPAVSGYSSPSRAYSSVG